MTTKFYYQPKTARRKTSLFISHKNLLVKNGLFSCSVAKGTEKVLTPYVHTFAEREKF